MMHAELSLEDVIFGWAHGSIFQSGLVQEVIPSNPPGTNQSMVRGNVDACLFE
jgi:hypothetical protein